MTTYINSLNEDVNEIQMFLNYNEVQYFAEAGGGLKDKIKKFLQWIKNIGRKVLDAVKNVFKKIQSKFKRRKNIKNKTDFKEEIKLKYEIIELPRTNTQNLADIADAVMTVKEDVNVQLTYSNYQEALNSLSVVSSDNIIKEIEKQGKEWENKAKNATSEEEVDEARNNATEVTKVLSRLATIAQEYQKFIAAYEKKAGES